MKSEYSTEVFVKKISVPRLESYLDTETVLEACKQCNHYGKDWSCPPGQPCPHEYFRPYKDAYLVAVKIIYTPELRAKITTAEGADRIRQDLFQKVQLHLQCILLELEKKIPGSLSISTCLLCPTCARELGKPCRHPKDQRYSMTCLGFQFTDLLEKEFAIPLLWQPNGLPEYHVTVSALLV